MKRSQTVRAVRFPGQSSVHFCRLICFPNRIEIARRPDPQVFPRSKIFAVLVKMSLAGWLAKLWATDGAKFPLTACVCGVGLVESELFLVFWKKYTLQAIFFCFGKWFWIPFLRKIRPKIEEIKPNSSECSERIERTPCGLGCLEH